MNSFAQRTLLAFAFLTLAAQFVTLARAGEAAAACHPAPLSVPTSFPLSAQQQGAHGTVVLAFRLGTDGRAKDAVIAQSSGFTQLDQAALAGLRNDWRFDVGRCSASQLDTPHNVTVQFERAKPNTLSNTRDGKAIAKSRELAADQRCASSSMLDGVKVFSCVHTESAGSDVQLADERSQVAR